MPRVGDEKFLADGQRCARNAFNSADPKAKLLDTAPGLLRANPASAASMTESSESGST